MLNQELSNKEIMFIRLQNREQECDDLKKKVNLKLNSLNKFLKRITI